MEKSLENRLDGLKVSAKNLEKQIKEDISPDIEKSLEKLSEIMSTTTKLLSEVFKTDKDV